VAAPRISTPRPTPASRRLLSHSCAPFIRVGRADGSARGLDFLTGFGCPAAPTTNERHRPGRAPSPWRRAPLPPGACLARRTEFLVGVYRLETSRAARQSSPVCSDGVPRRPASHRPGRRLSFREERHDSDDPILLCEEFSSASRRFLFTSCFRASASRSVVVYLPGANRGLLAAFGWLRRSYYLLDQGLSALTFAVGVVTAS